MRWETIVAPPGYGKTMLLADWAGRAGRDVAWLTLDDFDNAPSVFLTYLAAAIDRIGPERHEKSRMAKDLGSLAVLLASVLAGLLWIAAVAARFWPG